MMRRVPEPGTMGAEESNRCQDAEGRCTGEGSPSWGERPGVEGGALALGGGALLSGLRVQTGRS